MLSDVAQGKEVLTVNIRYKEPDGYRSKFDAFAVEDDGNSFRQASEDFRFASAVALFGMLLKESPYAGTADWDDVLNIAADAIGTDEDGYRAEFIELVRQASAATDQLAAAVREAGETLSNLLQYDKHLTDDPNITFTFFAANNSGYTFTTQHAKSKKVFLFKD
ncbi:MAG: DUF3520 domain-containing protein [Deltaproteobacteria bacterium]|nr:DUF3520 domain-containing protein [Deltaproteobacteria bacterium]